MTETKMNPDGEMEEVIWVDIKGWEGLYAVNQFGDVKSYEKILRGRWANSCRITKEIILKQYVRRLDGLTTVMLATTDNNNVQHKRTYSVSRLVAGAFLDFDIEDVLQLITYIDDNPRNTYYKNLKIVNRSELSSKSHTKQTKRRLKSIIVLFADGSKAKYESVTQASYHLGMSDTSIRIRLNKAGTIINGFGCRYITEEELDQPISSIVLTDDLLFKKLQGIPEEDSFKINPDGEMEKVIWVEVKGWEGLYSVNQFGDVKSHSRLTPAKKSESVYVHGVNLLLSYTEQNKMTTVIFHQGDRRENINVRRLVAEAFLGFDRYDKTLVSTNKDGDSKNNYYKNIELLSQTEASRRGNKGRKRLSTIKPVMCENQQGEQLFFDSITEAMDHFSIKARWMIIRSIRNPNKFYDGWKWSYWNLPEHQRITKQERDKRIIKALNEGLSIAKICEMLHVAGETVNKVKNRLKGDDYVRD